MASASAMRRVSRLLGLVLVSCALAGGAWPVLARPTDESPALNPGTWVTNGTVTSVAAGEQLYLAGDFTYIGPPTGGAAVYTQNDGAPVAFPRVEGTVFAALPAQGGGWFLGGEFTSVGGQPRRNLARIDANGALDTGWRLDADGPVMALAEHANRLYIGGRFATLGGSARNRLGAVSSRDASVTSFRADANGDVLALAVQGNSLYVGGSFTSIAGSERQRLASFDLPAGKLAGWAPQVYNADEQQFGTVLAIAAQGNTVYIGGRFRTVNGQPRNRLAALDARAGTVLPWNPGVADPFDDRASEVRALAVQGNTLYAGGAFGVAGGAARAGLAAFALQDGSLLPFAPTVGTVNALLVDSNTLFVGGRFSMVNGQPRTNFAALDVRDGSLTPWRTDTDDAVTALAAQGNRLLIGGGFTSIGGVARAGVAAIDPASGRATDWAPQPDGAVLALAVQNGTIYLGGRFGAINGQPRTSLAAVDTAGALLGWDARLSAPITGTRPEVREIVPDGGAVYIGGRFQFAGDARRTNLAAISTETGAATAWNARVENDSTEFSADIATVLPAGDAVFVAGEFEQIGGLVRPALAALRPDTGDALPWDPQIDGVYQAQVQSLAASDGTLFVGGTFSKLGGETRNNLAALSRTSGDALPWRADITGVEDEASVAALLVRNGLLFVGGDFDTVDGQGRQNLAAVTIAESSVNVWKPQPDGTVDSLTDVQSQVIAGGGFAMVSGTDRPGVAAYQLSGPVLTTTPATNVRPDEATLNGIGNAIEKRYNLLFQLTRTRGDYRNAVLVKATPATMEGSAPTSASVRLGSLLKETTYYYRLVAQEGPGAFTYTGEERTFITPEERRPPVTSPSVTLFMPLVQR